MSGAKLNHFCAEESNDVGKRRPFYVSVQAESLSFISDWGLKYC